MTSRTIYSVSKTGYRTLRREVLTVVHVRRGNSRYSYCSRITPYEVNPTWKRTVLCEQCRAQSFHA